MDFLKDFPVKNGVYYLTEPDRRFEKKYLALREKEQRIYTDEEVKTLPYPEKGQRYSSEWSLRAKSTKKVLRNLQKNTHQKTRILDVGCGNGWFTSHLSNLKNAVIAGLDINQKELEQAARVFGNDRCRFAFGDIFRTDFRNDRFQYITLNACVQYFPDLPALLNRLIRLLGKAGEIHIIDSPFYSKEEIPEAKARSLNYYRNLGFEGMSAHYFHHSWDKLAGFNYKVLYRPDSINRKIKDRMGLKDSPFPWICIHNGK